MSASKTGCISTASEAVPKLEEKVKDPLLFLAPFLVLIIITPLDPLEPYTAADASFKTEIVSTCSCGIELIEPLKITPSTTISGEAEAFIDPTPLILIV